MRKIEKADPFLILEIEFKIDIQFIYSLNFQNPD